MRFSLLTLILLVLWVAVLMFVWTNRQRWSKKADPLSPVAVKQLLPEWRAESVEALFSIDGYTLVKNEGVTLDEGWLELAKPILRDENRVVGCVDNDTAVLVESSDLTQFYVWQRRFPWQWWGHFYRPEVWALFALTLMLIWRGVRHFRSLRAIP